MTRFCRDDDAGPASSTPGRDSEQLTASDDPPRNRHLQKLRVEKPRLVAWQLIGDRIDVELTLDATSEDRTRASLVVEGPWLVGLSRSLPRKALSRLYSLCQTGADL